VEKSILKMKIIVINSSPRKGNIVFMLDHILKDIDADVIKLIDKKIGWCMGGDDCCPRTGRCYSKDDMPEVYDKLEKADLIVLASPCYFSNVNAIMKNFMDRCNPYYFNKLLKDKKFFLLAVGGQKESTKGAIDAMRKFVKGVHAEIIGEYMTVADKKGDLVENSKVIKELEDISKELMKNG